MSHQSWYRKYRPQRFDDVVGQAHIERTIRNAVEDGAIAHAYLFTGPRGTGKTTTARLLAKALNCQSGPTGEPDDTCEDCREIAEGRHPDVYELDAASRTGVESVREEIIGRVNYAPTRGRWKIYIIDEAHMLSIAAFNALLKTLEEPPPHTVFVLCTTHPHKVPETIHSRCQRFEFRRLGVDEISARLRHVADSEGVEVPDAALALIARHASGGMRDAIMTLEQLASFTAGTISLEDVENLLGEVGSDELFELIDLVAAGDLAGIFRFVAELAERGADVGEFVKALTRHVRDLFVALVLPEPDAALDVTAPERARLAEQATGLGLARLARMLDVLEGLTGSVRVTADARLALEVALTRLAHPEADITVEALAERVEALERAIGGAQETATARESFAPRRPAKDDSEPSAVVQEQGAAGSTASEVAPVVATTATGLDPKSLKRSWPAVLAEMRKRRRPRSHLFDSTEPEVVGDALVVEFPRDRGFAMDLAREAGTLSTLRECVEAVFGVSPPIEFRLGREGVSSPAEAASPGHGSAVDNESEATAQSEPPVVAEGYGDEGAQDIEARLIAELGASVVEEREVPDSENGRP